MFSSLLVALSLPAAAAVVDASPAASSYAVDALAAGPRFDGVGAISGGGGETVLLPAYPAKQRAEVFDYLFKPSFGAALHILKLEIGGDGLSTDGAEPSHMHVGTEPPNFQRGYEWWVAKEAKARSKSTLIYGLPWEWPAWVGNGASGKTASPWVNISNAVRYTMEWIKGAQRVHNLHTDFIGLWNERPYDSGYVLALRAALDASGFASTRIIGPDGPAAGFWNETQTDPTFAAAVHAIGFHYPNSNPSKTVPGINGPDGSGSIALWASEDDSTVSPPKTDAEMPSPHPREQPGGGCLVRTLNENFVQGNLTATIVWNLIMARYPQMRWDYTGLVAATDPFGGHYSVLPAVWAAAHTTQFTQPGYKLLPVGKGSGYLQHGGTFVTYVGPAGEITIVVEKMDANKSECERGQRNAAQQQVVAAERATFTVTGLLNSGAAAGAAGAAGAARVARLAVWKSNFGIDPYSDSGAGLFEQGEDVAVGPDGAVSIELLPNWVSIHTHTHTHIYIHIYVYICIYIYIYICSSAGIGNWKTRPLVCVLFGVVFFFW
eukprot:COSAG06_NODE_116_length_23262_cov_47.854034_2_plen_548_part_00